MNNLKKSILLASFIVLFVISTAQAYSTSGALQVGTVVPVICKIEKNELQPLEVNIHCNTNHRLTISYDSDRGSASLTYNGENKTISRDTPNAYWSASSVVIGTFRIVTQGDVDPNDITISISPM